MSPQGLNFCMPDSWAGMNLHCTWRSANPMWRGRLGVGRALGSRRVGICPGLERDELPALSKQPVAQSGGLCQAQAMDSQEAQTADLTW